MVPEKQERNFHFCHSKWITKKHLFRDLPGSPVVKTLKFHPWLGERRSRMLATVWPKKKKKKKYFFKEIHWISIEQQKSVRFGMMLRMYLQLWVMKGTLTGCSKKTGSWASPLVPWLRIHLAMQGTPVRSLVQEDPTHLRAAEPTRCEYQAHGPRLLKPSHRRARLCVKSSHNNEKTSSSPGE